MGFSQLYFPGGESPLNNPLVTPLHSHVFFELEVTVQLTQYMYDASSVQLLFQYCVQ